MAEIQIREAPDISWWGNDDPGDICSWCMKKVPEHEVPLLLFRGEGAQMEIARFHNACAEPALGLKITTADRDEDESDYDYMDLP